MACTAESLLPKVTTNNGIEVTQSVTYQNWEPGKEYTKNIVLKNLRVKTQKLTYNTPESRFFSTLYPKQITLSAGTTYQLPVTFRPLERDVYQDCIRFNQQGESFSVPIKAVLPEFNISTPEEVHVPICAVKDETSTTFTIHNKSELLTPFHWNVQDCFVIEPSQGVLSPRGNLKLTVHFRPKMAGIHRCDAKCVHGTEENAISTTTFSAVAKFPHLLVCRDGDFYNADSSVVVNFGEVPLGQSAQKAVQIHNMSHVEAKCTVQQPSSMSSASVERTFSCSKTRMVIPANSSAVLAIKYSPVNVSSRDSSNVSYFYVDCVSDISRLTIKCQGTAIGPSLQLSTEAINFSLVQLGQSGTKVIEILNQSAASSCYQFKLDCRESVFKFDYVGGRLAGGEKKKVIVKFCPTHAINYYRRVHCVIDNQDPLYIDLLGTAHSETVKPAVLELKHLQQFTKNTERGLGFFPPEHLNEMIAHGKLQVDPTDNSLMSSEAESVEPWLTPVTAVPPLDLYFNDGYHSDITHEQPLVSLDTIHADFGRCENMATIEPLTIRLTNHTHGKIVAQWMGNSSHIFHVSPDTIELAAQKTADFRVTFKPDAPNNLYGNELECFCYYKSLRDYRLVDSLTHAPPVCLTVTATGNTFLPNQISFLPQIKFSRDEIVFPATNQNEAVYQTITVSNLSGNPVVYDMQSPATGSSADDSVVSVKPAKGIIAGKTEEIFVIRALPSQTRLYRERLHVNMNNDKQYTQEVDVVCSAETADILLSNDGHVYFKQTCVGMSSCRTYHAKNISRMPLEFRWTVPGDYRDVLKVEPNVGLLMPNEEQVYWFTFTPTEACHYAIKPALVVMAQGQTKEQSSGKPKIYPVRVIGEGTEGKLEAGEPYIEFGNVVVGSSTARIIDLHNPSDCTLRYELCVEEEQDEKTGLQSFNPNVLILDQYRGEIPAQSTVSVRATVKPLSRCRCNFNITYRLVTDREDNSTVADTSDNQLLLQASVVGVFPVLGINDARIHGSGIGISKKQLWSLFQLDTFNMYLNSDPAGRELLYSVQTRNSTRRRPPTLTRAVLDFNFGAAPVDTEPCHVTLHVENTGTVDCEWEFLFPSDLKIDLECWSEERDYTIDELHEMKVMDNKLFTVSPHKGRLEPGASCAITLTYKHLMAGTDRLPVLLKLSRGREILVNFIGVTTERGVPYIHFSSDEHSFAPVAIGEKECPKQIYELYNGGSVPVKFEVDTLPLETLKSENFDHTIIECLTPRGVIPPGRSFSTEWAFHPLEARTYEVSLPIVISGGETAIITFTGVGYDKKQLGDSLPAVAESNTLKVPPVQTVTVPGQLAMLSHERVALGNVPLYTKSRKVIFITNISDHVLSYSWHVTNDGDQRMVNVFPARGSLQPRASQMVKVTFTSWIGKPAAFYEMDMVCEVVDETGMAAYRRKLGEWEDERERQIHEFTITEKDLMPKQRHVTRSNGQSRYINSSKAGTQLNGTGRDVEVTKKQLITSIDQKLYKPYKTLPPILDQSVDRERAIALEQRKLDALAHKKPSPPKPFLLHLGITARTHSIDAYQEEFFEDMNTFYIDRVLNDDSGNKPQNTERLDEQTANRIPCDTMQKSFVTSMISNVLRSLVDDPSFHQSVTRLSDESTPYFNQFYTGMRPPTQPSSSALDQDLERPLEQEETTQSRTRKTDLTGGSAATLSPSSTTDVQISQTNVVSSESPHKQMAEDVGISDAHSKAIASHNLTGDITRSAMFGNMVEGIIENTLANVLMEAASGEMNITARPRLIALPPRRSSPAN